MLLASFLNKKKGVKYKGILALLPFQLIQMIMLKAINKPAGAEVTGRVYQTGAAVLSEVLDHCRGLSSFSLSHLAFEASALDHPETSAKI